MEGKRPEQKKTDQYNPASHLMLFFAPHPPHLFPISLDIYSKRRASFYQRTLRVPEALGEITETPSLPESCITRASGGGRGRRRRRLTNIIDRRGGGREGYTGEGREEGGGVKKKIILSG